MNLVRIGFLGYLLKEVTHNCIIVFEWSTMYQEHLMDHYRYPRNRKLIQNPSFTSEVYNPSCGDSVSFMGSIVDDCVQELGFQGSGCVISQAVASQLTQVGLNKNLTDIMLFDVAMIRVMVGIELGPTRLRCALLPLEALQQGISDYVKRKQGL